MARHGFDMLQNSFTQSQCFLLPPENMWCSLLISLWYYCRKPKTLLRTTFAAMTSTFIMPLTHSGKIMCPNCQDDDEDEYEEGKAVFDQDGTVADYDEVDDSTIKAIEDEIN